MIIFYFLQTKIIAADYIEDVNTNLAALRSSVATIIDESEQAINKIANNSLYTRFDLWTDETQMFYTEYENIFDRLKTVKNLATTYNANINVCLQWREDVILGLTKRCNDDLDACVEPYKNELEEIQKTSISKVRRFIASVEAFSLQIQQCDKVRSCIETIVEKTESFKKEVSDYVNAEVQKVDVRVQALNIYIQNCMDRGFAYMVNTGAGVVDTIAKCAHEIIG